MSGHSKWASIKHKKAALDAKRGKVFTRLIREIQIAAREGGADPDGNPRLRSAITTAKSQSMPQDNIKRAVLRGSGQMEGENFDEVSFEGYGPAGVAVMVDVVTDNRNRTVSEIRHHFAKHGGNLGENGCVSWIFDKCSLIAIPKSSTTEESLMELVLATGADDIRDEGDNWVIVSPVEAHHDVLQGIESAGLPLESAEVTQIPQNSVKVAGKQAAAVLRMIEALEDQDDTQNVYANFDIDDDELEKLAT
jgi:YebC/PmpR family DNA-binding regulatory protein